MRRRTSSVALVFWLASVLSLQPAQAGRKEPEPEKKTLEFIVIVHPKNQINDIPMYALRAIFLKQKQNWPDGTPIIVINFKARSRPRAAFDYLVSRMLPDEVAAYWVDRRIRGKGSPPRSLNSSRLIQRIVARHPGVISYVPADELTETVKILKVDGQAPGTGRYPLRREKNQ